MTQQYVILSNEVPTDNGMAPIGSREEILNLLASYNTAPEDGDVSVLFGPGIRIELPPDQDPVPQMVLSVVEDEIAWLVIMRLAKELKWKILDPMTGRELKP